MLLVYCAISAACLETAFVGLITKKLTLWKYMIFFVYLFLSCWMMEMHIGQFAGVFVFGGSVILVLVFVREQVLWNVFLVSLGYLMNVLLNNFVMLMSIKFFGFNFITMSIEQKSLFSLVYFLILCGIMLVWRYLLYEKLQARKYFQISKVVKMGVVVECLFFAGLFIINVANGDKIGYSQKVIMFNLYLFVICMLINIVLLVICGYMVKKEEERKFIESKNQVLYDYVKEVDSIVTEWRLFHHDYKNVMYTAAGFLMENRYEELKEFWNRELTDFGEETESQKRWENLSNIMPLEIKGVFYEKISRGLSEGIETKLEVIEKVEIKGINLLDLSRLLGIYLDNALEAAKEAPVPVIWITVEKTNRGCHIRIENTMKGKADLAKIAEKGYSTKGKAKRGLGLYSAGKILKRYDNVYINTLSEEGKFSQELDIIAL